MSIILLSLLSACTPTDPALSGDVVASATDVPSVMRLEWYVVGAADCWVTWQDASGAEHETTGEQLAPEHWQALLVASADEVLSYQVWVDGVMLGSGESETELDTFSVETLGMQGRFSAATATSLYIDDAWFPVVLDEGGVPRWWVDDFDEDRLTLRVRPDERGVWFSRFSVDPEDFESAEIHRVGWDGEVLKVIEAPGHHHDFWVHSDGTLVWIAFEPYEQDGVVSYGEALWRRSPGGEAERFFSLREAFPELTNVDWGDGETWAWANHLDFDGQYFWLSLHHRGVYLRLTEDGSFAGMLGDADHMGGAPDWLPDEAFADQHGGTVTPEGTFLLHDNSGGPDGVRLMELELDDAAERAEVVWTLGPPEDWESPALGDAVRDEQGNTLASWGIFSTLEELDSAGRTTAKLRFEDSSFLGFLSPVELD